MDDDLKVKVINLFRLLLRMSATIDTTAMEYIANVHPNDEEFKVYLNALTFFFSFYLDLRCETLKSKDLCYSDKPLFRLFKLAKKINDEEDLSLSNDDDLNSAIS